MLSKPNRDIEQGLWNISKVRGDISFSYSRRPFLDPLDQPPDVPL